MNINLCELHQQPLGICIKSHLCQRKYCKICHFYHGGNEEWLTAKQFSNKFIHDFSDIISKVEKQFKSNEDLFNQMQKIYQELKDNFFSRKNSINFQISQIQTFSSNNTDVDYINTIITQRKTHKLFLTQLEEIMIFCQKEMEIIMKNFNENTKGILKKEQESDSIWQIGKHQYQGMHYKSSGLEKFPFIVEFTKDFELKFQGLDGNILRYPNYGREQVKDLTRKPEILSNYEQIKCLHWKGEYNNRNQKIGKWNGFWDNKLLPQVGGFYKNGMKDGLWKELTKNYSSFAAYLSQGYYYCEKKIGRWLIFGQIDRQIGCGSYGKYGKTGKWVELDEQFYYQKKVIHNGEYNTNMKVGRWEIMYCDINGDGQYKQIIFKCKCVQWWWIVQLRRKLEKVWKVGRIG